MASLISTATGNFTTATTWGLVDNAATTGVSYLDSEANNTALTTVEANNETASFAWLVTAPTIDGIAVKIASRAASPSGTFTVKLRNQDAGSDVASATINVSDVTDAGQGGWYFFSLGSQTLVAATNYRIRCYTSSSNQINLYRDATATNWSRQLRTTTTQAPASGDQLHVIGKWNSAGNQTAYTVTMDETATTSYGPTVSGGPPQGITVGSGGTWTNGTAASTAYYFKWKGTFAVYPSGTVNVGTSGTRMPSTSSAIYEMASVANVDTGLSVFPLATFNAYGDNGRLVYTTLTADLAAAGTGITVVSTSGWVANDELVFTSTSATASQFEKKTASAIGSSTTATIGAATNAHSGTSPTQGYVGNITRNVTFRGLGTSTSGYIYFQTTSTTVLDYVRCELLGSSTSNKNGIVVATTTGSCTINKCAIIDSNTSAFSAVGVYITGATANNITVTSNVIYNIYSNILSIATATSGTSITIDSNLGIGTNSIGNYIFTFADVGGTITNNIASGSGSSGGYFLNETAATIGAFTGNTALSNAAFGLNIGVVNGTIGTFTAWRSVIGINFAASSDIIVNTPTLFGNTTGNINSTGGGTIQINNGVLNGGVTTVAAVGLRITGSAGPTIAYVNSTTFGTTTAHSSSDITLFNNTTAFVYLNNCLLSTSTEFGTQTALSASSFIGSEKHDQSAGTHKFWRKYGTGTIDTTIYDVTPSLRMTPNNASNKFESMPFRMVVANGTTLTVSVKVRESVAGDGTDYNGNPIRLIVKRNDALGITSDTVLATATGASVGAFETISGTTASVTDDGTLEFVVDCDGTTGWINVDTASFTPSVTSLGFKYWLNGFPTVYGNNITETSHTFC